jgi:hypothetical protein
VNKSSKSKLWNNGKIYLERNICLTKTNKFTVCKCIRTDDLFIDMSGYYRREYEHICNTFNTFEEAKWWRDLKINWPKNSTVGSKSVGLSFRETKHLKLHFKKD